MQKLLAEEENFPEIKNEGKRTESEELFPNKTVYLARLGTSRN